MWKPHPVVPPVLQSQQQIHFTLEWGVGGLDYQASTFTEAMKAMASYAPGLDLGTPLNDSCRLCDFLMEVPFTDLEKPFTLDIWPRPFMSQI